MTKTAQGRTKITTDKEWDVHWEIQGMGAQSLRCFLEPWVAP